MTTLTASRPATAPPPLRRRIRVAGLAAGLVLLLGGAGSLGWPQVSGRLYERSQAQLLTELRATNPQAPQQGAGWARLLIPRLGVDAVVVEGVADADLRKGPGRYPSTAAPQDGVVGIAGHRTTWGAPFRHVDQLRPGDALELVVGASTYKYEVSALPFQVDPTQGSVLHGPSPAIVLTTCDPPGSAAKRLIVRADLVEGST